MAIIGNDLVAIDGLEIYRRKGYLRKAFTDAEISRCPSTDGLIYFGMLWACKESAYKVFAKKGFRKAFSPKKYYVEFTWDATSGLYRGCVCYDTLVFHTLVSIKSRRYIYALSSDQLFAIDDTFSAFSDIAEEDPFLQSEAARILTRKVLINRYSFTPTLLDDRLQYRRNYPALIRVNNEKQIDLSISHDYKFVAVACLEQKIPTPSRYDE